MEKQEQILRGSSGVYIGDEPNINGDRDTKDLGKATNGNKLSDSTNKHNATLSHCLI